MIEIGQFLYMKKLENKKIMQEVMAKLSIACISRVSDAFMKEPTNSTKPIETKTTNLNSGASLFEWIFLLSEVLKVFPLKYFTSSNILSRIGPRNKVIQNKRDEIIPNGSPSSNVSNAKEDPIPRDIIDAKIKFHLRVWVNQLFLAMVSALLFPLFSLFSSVVFCIKFVCNYGLKTNHFIISEIKPNSKQIILKALIILGFLMPKIAVANECRLETNDLSVSIEKIIALEEQRNDIPKGLLRSIAFAESNMDPYVLDEKGKASRFSSFNEALKSLELKIKSGVSNIDIGIMQINYRWHRDAFRDLNAMLDPSKNIAYAARLLKNLKERFGDWQTAIRHYHSSNLKHSSSYSRKVTLAWLNDPALGRK